MESKISKTWLIAIVMLLALAGMQSALAAIYYTPTYANISENFMLNITISASQNTNITQVVVEDISTMPFTKVLSSNGTSIPNVLGANVTFRPIGNTVFTWYNQTGLGAKLIDNSTNQSFTITLNNSLAGAPSSFRLRICVYNTTNVTRNCDNIAANGLGQVENTTATIGMDFGFSGYVKNDTGEPQPNTNVTIYDFVMNSNGPPGEVPIASALTDSNGLFRLWGINGSKSLYKIKLVYNNSVPRAMLVGPNLPPFPGNMFYPMPMPPGVPAFKKMPVINGTTFYLQPAATINVSAVGNVPTSNESTTGNSVKFGYELIDQAVGFPIESNVRNTAWNKEIVVSIGRSYTAIAMRDPISFPAGDWCFQNDVPVMNATACPSPPMSASIASSDADMTQGGYKNVVINLTYSMQYLSGCINLYGNSSLVNLTNVITRLVPWTGFVPPMEAKISAFNATNGSANLIYGDARCAGSGNWNAFYNMSLMGSGTGIGYLLEFYAKNATDNAGNPGAAYNLAAFQNLTMNSASQWINLTLRPLAGSYHDDIAGASVNTTKMKIFVQNTSGSAVTTSMHVEVKVKNPAFGTMHYIIEDISNGITYLPMLNNSNWAKVSVYPNEAPPVEKTLELTATQNNVTVVVGDFTFRKPLQNGSLEAINVSKGSDGTDPLAGINMTFYRNMNGCNTPNPLDATCLLTRMDANNFNPMAVMMAGKVNLELKMTGSGTTLYFVNFDLLSAKPPTNSIMNNNASSASSSAQTQTWEQGSFVPHVYDYAFVVMPYSTTSTAADYVNEEYSFNMSLPFLRDENWNVAWNRSTNTTAQLPDDYTDFNTGSYVPLLTTVGVACNTTNTTDVCYWDKTNNWFVLKVPHFSGVGSSFAGTAPAAAATAATTGSSSTGGSTTETEPLERHTIALVSPNELTTVDISNSDEIGVYKLVFTATETITNAEVTVQKKDGRPSSISESPEGAIYSYFEINAPKLEDKLKEAKIRFEVKKEWLEDAGLDAGQIVLQRYNSGSWRELTTNLLHATGPKAYYEAVSPGFSYFAITAKEKAVPEIKKSEEPSETPEEAAKRLAEEEKAASKRAWKTWLTVLIIAVIVIAVAALVYRNKHALAVWRESTDSERREHIRRHFLRRKKGE